MLRRLEQFLDSFFSGSQEIDQGRYYIEVTAIGRITDDAGILSRIEMESGLSITGPDKAMHVKLLEVAKRRATDLLQIDSATVRSAEQRGAVQAFPQI